MIVWFTIAPALFTLIPPCQRVSRTAGAKSQPDHTVPYGTGSILDRFQAINCLEPIIQSLQDTRISSPPILETDSRIPLGDKVPKIG